MAILGQFGIVELSREWPAPTALADERLQRGATPSLDLSNLTFQSGDEVLVLSLRGVPLGIGISGAAPCPDGHAFWPGGATSVGPALAARTAFGRFWDRGLPAGIVPMVGYNDPSSPNHGNYIHLASGSILVDTAAAPPYPVVLSAAPFWEWDRGLPAGIVPMVGYNDPSSPNHGNYIHLASGSILVDTAAAPPYPVALGAAPFWESVATVGFQQTATAFIHRDEMDDVRFYSTELDAINGGSTGLIPLRNVSPGPMLILPASTAAGYNAAALQLLQSIANLDIPDGEQPAENLATVPEILTNTAADVTERGWLKQCDLTSWVFEMDATTLDHDAIGQAFGESAKGVVRGAGSFDGEIDHSYVSGEQSGLGMLRLMMLTQQGSKARARFQLVDQRNAILPMVHERVFYETDILLGTTTVNASATDVIKMSAQFIATGHIRLAKQD